MRNDVAVQPENASSSWSRDTAMPDVLLLLLWLLVLVLLLAVAWLVWLAFCCCCLCCCGSGVAVACGVVVVVVAVVVAVECLSRSLPKMSRAAADRWDALLVLDLAQTLRR
jgi:hypothetical protein